MGPDPQIDQLLEERLEETAGQRKHVLERYADQDWARLAPVEQTVNRLEYLQQIDAAQDYQRRTEELGSLEGLEGLAPPGGARSDADIADLGQVVFEKIIGRSEIMPIRFVHEGSRVARSVGRIVFRTLRRANGTGFLVSPRLLLTNFHVLPDPADALTNLVQFDYLTKPDGSTVPPVEFNLQPDVLFLQNPITELDCALVAVEPINRDGVDLSQFGWCTLVGQVGKEHQGERVNVVHHPGGSPKQVSLRENFVALILDDYLHYMTDTAPGSSGSPVFNDEWDVVALHHAGREITDADEIELYRTALGSNLPGGASAEETLVTVNEGARISRIVEWLGHEADGLVGEARALLDEALANALETTTAVPHTEEVVPNSGAQVTINIHVGRGLAPSITTTASGPTASTGLELFKGEAERAVVRGLAVLQERREGDYLDPPATLVDDIAEYYGDLPAEVGAGTLSPSELYDALHNRISEAGGLTIAGAFPDNLEALETLHRTALEGLGLESSLILEDAKYDRSRAHLYTWADLHPDRMLHCIYTGALIAPEQLLLKDLLTDLDLRDELPRSFRNNQFLNCEHVVPQSWFGKEPVAKADLHHLFTAHGTANLFRSNSVYEDLQGNPAAALGPANAPTYVGPAGLKATGPKRFEPFASSRPIVARATLYFLIAHRGKVDDSKIDAEQVELLIEWSNLAQPGEYEKHRNQAIFDVQQNRNPLIDFPDWVDHIDFMRGVHDGG